MADTFLLLSHTRGKTTINLSGDFFRTSCHIRNSGKESRDSFIVKFHVMGDANIDDEDIYNKGKFKLISEAMMKKNQPVHYKLDC